MEGGASISKVSGTSKHDSDHRPILLTISKVEYHDPSGVFPLVSRQLNSYLPLRDLNWKSPTRPLRSIDSLHVDLVAAQDFDRPGSRNGPLGVEQSSSPARTPGERRHQIPGLRQTPYLKVFLLRCDDSDSYKSIARKALREWLKAHTPASQSSSSRSSQENHDAFEWLIVHVVLPNTQAASQPRISGSSSRSESTGPEKSGGSSKLLGRSSSTILEKIRSDFNVSSKSAPDRVEQIRLRIEDLPPDAVPRPQSTIENYHETPREYGQAWQELINKLKTLILSSFSLRVNQYEDDIRERDSQRALPGWNFCTFFMLKEGLLRGFESVGLVDDALIGYDELSLGLEQAMNDSNEDGMTTRSDSFLKYTKEMKDLLLQCLTSDSTLDMQWKSGTQIISTARKDYRNLIVNSNVSRFDFQSYIFARQISILLRMSTPTLVDPSQQTKGPLNISALSELCQRATSFISEASRTLKAELQQAASAQGVSASSSIMDNIIASFGFAVADQVLSLTDVPILKQAWDDSAGIRQHQDMDRLQHPERKSSLPPKSPMSQRSDDPLTMLKHLDLRISMQQRGDDELSVAQVGDLEILAGNRADLLLLQRQASEKVADNEGWAAGASRLGQHRELTDVDLGEETKDDDTDSATFRGVLYSTLLDGLSSLQTYHELYERLTHLALMQCVLAIRTRSAERLCVDMAVIKYDEGDYTTALNLLARIVTTFASRDWDMIETELVSIYLKCLKKLNRKDAFVRMALSSLSKTAARRRSRRNALHIMADDEEEKSEALLEDVLDVAADLPSIIGVPMNDFLVDVAIEPYIRHFEDRDGFNLNLKLKSLLPSEVRADTIRMKLRSIEPPFREIWLEASSTQIAPGMNLIDLDSHAICSGHFAVEKLAMTAGKISFEVETSRSVVALSGEQRPPTTDGSLLSRMPHILCHPTDQCLIATVRATRDVHINKTRMLEVHIQTGRNAIEKGQLSLRAASAGLRLKTAEASVENANVRLGKGKEPGILELSSLDANSEIVLLLPYDLESNLPQIGISLDVTYTTSTGTYQYLTNPSIPVDLALDVNVHDLFRNDLLFSRFQIRASRGIPIVVTAVELSDTDRFAVEAPPIRLTPMLVLPQQDGTLLYKIEPKSQAERQSLKQEQPLQLVVEYQPLDEKVLATMRQTLLPLLEDSSVADLKHLLEGRLARVCRTLSHAQLEEVALLNEFHLPEYEATGWDVLLDGLQPSMRQELSSLLRQWHTQHGTLSLARDAIEEGKSHSITIDVPLPRLQILHTASISLSSTDFVSQGTVLTAKVSVHHTRRWETPSATGGGGAHELDFSLEVDAPHDTWLLGGDRRAAFSSAERQIKTFELLLIPLKTGRLLLPEVNIRWNGQGEEEIRCETDFRSAGEIVIVVADVKSTTVGLNEMGTGTEVMLMSSERR